MQSQFKYTGYNYIMLYQEHLDIGPTEVYSPTTWRSLCDNVEKKKVIR